jgi:Flp pilus assembly protein TadG
MSRSMNGQRGSRHGRTRGQTLVEFALVAPMFFALLIGVIEGGRYVFHAELLNNATREGARYQIVHGSASTTPPRPTGPTSADPTGEDIKQAVVDAGMMIEIDPGKVDVAWDPDNNSRGTTVTVTTEYVYFPIVSLFGPITITAESSLVINN